MFWTIKISRIEHSFVRSKGGERASKLAGFTGTTTVLYRKPIFCCSFYSFFLSLSLHFNDYNSLFQLKYNQGFFPASFLPFCCLFSSIWNFPLNTRRLTWNVRACNQYVCTIRTSIVVISFAARNTPNRNIKIKIKIKSRISHEREKLITPTTTATISHYLL